MKYQVHKITFIPSRSQFCESTCAQAVSASATAIMLWSFLYGTCGIWWLGINHFVTTRMTCWLYTIPSSDPPNGSSSRQTIIATLSFHTMHRYCAWYERTRFQSRHSLLSTTYLITRIVSDWSDQIKTWHCDVKTDTYRKTFPWRPCRYQCQSRCLGVTAVDRVRRTNGSSSRATMSRSHWAALFSCAKLRPEYSIGIVFFFFVLCDDDGDARHQNTCLRRKQSTLLSSFSYSSAQPVENVSQSASRYHLACLIWSLTLLVKVDSSHSGTFSNINLHNIAKNNSVSSRTRKRVLANHVEPT